MLGAVTERFCTKASAADNALAATDHPVHCPLIRGENHSGYFVFNRFPFLVGCTLFGQQRKHDA